MTVHTTETKARRHARPRPEQHHLDQYRPEQYRPEQYSPKQGPERASHGLEAGFALSLP